MLPITELRNELLRNGVEESKLPAGSLPVGELKNREGETVFYYAGPEPLPDFYLEKDSLIGGVCTLPFEDRKEGVEYYHSFSWDITKAGYVDITRLKHYSNCEKEVVRYYLTIHQPTQFSSLPDVDVRKWENWFRKIEVTFENGVVGNVWERFSRVEEVRETHLRKLLK